MSIHQPIVRRVIAFAALGLLPLACAGSPVGGGPGTYRGVLVGQSEIGPVEITAEAATNGPLRASGTLQLGGRVVSLSGTLDPSSTNLSLSSTEGYSLNGKSTPTYVTGTYQGPRGSGTFALLVQPTGASPVESFCGTFVSVAITNATPNLFAATALPGGDAICVGAGAAWLGSMDATGNLYCPSVGGGLYHGNVNADGGDNWQSNSDNQGNINDYGTWTLAPCEGSTPDAGVSSDLGNDQDAGASLSMDAGVAEGGGVPVDGGLD